MIIKNPTKQTEKGSASRGEISFPDVLRLDSARESRGE
jgi:hypothetical protein